MDFCKGWRLGFGLWSDLDRIEDQIERKRTKEALYLAMDIYGDVHVAFLEGIREISMIRSRLIALIEVLAGADLVRAAMLVEDIKKEMRKLR